MDLAFCCIANRREVMLRTLIAVQIQQMSRDIETSMRTSRKRTTPASLRALWEIVQRCSHRNVAYRI
ncbi:hypothetical protein ASF73_04240 [Xanthomonas sp. Leaf131]|nr:hypothetical protein ASF73_04240 [Xanthomonas sp. Leaf131]